MLNLNAVLADIETQAGVDAHVLVGDPDQSEAGNQVAAPVIEQQLVARDEQEKNGHVMAEAELACEKEIKFAAEVDAIVLTLAGAVFAGFAKNFFVRDRPGNAGDGNGQYEQPYQLHSERHS